MYCKNYFDKMQTKVCSLCTKHGLPAHSRKLLTGFMTSDRLNPKNLNAVKYAPLFPTQRVLLLLEYLYWDKTQ